VTSPSYYRLRSYLPADHPDKAQEIGTEESPEEYVARLVETFAEVKRVLRDDGTNWVVLGDSFSDGDLLGIPFRVAFALQASGWYLRHAIPWIKCNALPESVQGWRWERHRVKIAAQGEAANHSASKAGYNTGGPHPDNGLVRDSAQWTPCPGCQKCSPHGGYMLRRGAWRPTTAHEYIFMLAKSERYWADGEAVRMPTSESSLERQIYRGNQKTRGKWLDGIDTRNDSEITSCSIGPANPSGRNRRTTDWFNESLDLVIQDTEEWLEHIRAVRNDKGLLLDPNGDPLAMLVNPQPFSARSLGITDVDHFAAFPPKLVEPCILSSCPERVCAECGAGWVRIVDNTRKSTRPGTGRTHFDSSRAKGDRGIPLRPELTVTTLGFRPSCTCNSDKPPVPAVVLDPFSGTGTVGVVAEQLGRSAVLVEVSPDYVAMSNARLAAARNEPPEKCDAALPLFSIPDGGSRAIP